MHGHMDVTNATRTILGIVNTGVRPLTNSPNAQNLAQIKQRYRYFKRTLVTVRIINMTFGFCLSQAEEGECFTPVTTLETTYHVNNGSFAKLPTVTPNGIFKIHI